MSRTSFAERFRQVARVPPLTYLGQWRMTLAQRALRDDDTRIGQLAARLGYGSESAFSMRSSGRSECLRCGIAAR
jgi:AraC-like DNA-binding protein